MSTRYDAVGQRVEIGDYVVCGLRGGSSQVTVGRVTAFTGTSAVKVVLIVPGNRWKPYEHVVEETKRQFQFVKTSSVPDEISLKFKEFLSENKDAV